MSLTRIDCQFFQPEGTSSDESSFVAFNPSGMAGSLVIAAAHAARAGIGAQVACKLSLEHFTNGVLDYFGGDAEGDDSEISLSVLESAFKKANTSVYNFGHKLAAGGRLAASLIGLVVEDNVIAAGRVGPSSAFLYRDGELFPFFDEDAEENVSEDDYVGAKSLVTVELASVPVQASDYIFAFNGFLNKAHEVKLEQFAAELDELDEKDAQKCTSKLFGISGPPGGFLMIAHIGPDAIYLSEVIDEHEEAVGNS